LPRAGSSTRRRPPEARSLTSTAHAPDHRPRRCRRDCPAAARRAAGATRTRGGQPARSAGAFRVRPARRGRRVPGDQAALALRGTATVFGVTASIDATVSPQKGALVVQPNVPFGGLAAISVFANPHVEVQSVAASDAPGGFAVSAQGRLR